MFSNVLAKSLTVENVRVKVTSSENISRRVLSSDLLGGDLCIH